MKRLLRAFLLICLLFNYAPLLFAADLPTLPGDSQEEQKNTEPTVPTYLESVQSCANKQDEGFSFSNCITTEDKAVYYLERMFGDVGDVLKGQAKGIQGANGLLGALFNIYNILVLTIGTIVLVYTTVVSTINTAQEGEVMGKKWSSIWIPIRSAAGVAFLMPTIKGYSIVQVLVMWIIVQSIGAGNAMWEVALKYTMTHGGIGGSKYDIGMRDVVKAALWHVVCQETINKDPTTFEGLIIEQDKISNGFQFGARYQTITSIEQQYLPSFCGSIQIPATVYEGDGAADTASTAKRKAADALAKQIKFQALQAMYQYLDSQVYIALNTTDKTALESSLLGTIDIAIGKYSAVMDSLVSVDSLSEDDKTLIQNAMLDGWIFAGSYYFKMAQGGSSNLDMILKIPPTTTDIYGGMPTAWKKKIEKNYDLITQYAGNLDQTNSLNLGGGNTGGQAGSALSAGNSAAVEVAVKFAEYLSTNNKDPIMAMQKVGSDMALTIEILFFSAIALMITISAIGWFMPYPGLIGTGWLASDIVSFILPIVALICGLLWGAAMTLGLYVPMIPYLVFTIASISWLLLVLETMVAAPLIALGLVAPSQDTLGKASPAVLMVTNVFMRPALMIIGFMSGAQLLRVAIELLNFGFREAVGSQIGTLGIFGAIALIILYTSLILSVTHKCFSLIHVIPDRVIRWIGGTAGQSTDSQELQKTQGGFEQGSKQLGDMQEKGLSAAGEKLHTLGKKGNKLDPGGVQRKGGKSLHQINKGK